MITTVMSGMRHGRLVDPGCLDHRVRLEGGTEAVGGLHLEHVLAVDDRGPGYGLEPAGRFDRAVSVELAGDRYPGTVLWHEKTMPAQGKCRIRCKALMFTEPHPANSAQRYVVEAVK